MSEEEKRNVKEQEKLEQEKLEQEKLEQEKLEQESGSPDSGGRKEFSQQEQHIADITRSIEREPQPAGKNRLTKAKNWLAQNNNTKRIGVMAAILLLIFFSVFIMIQAEKEPEPVSSLSLSSVVSFEGLFQDNGHLQLLGAEKYSIKYLQENLVFEPESEFVVTKTKEKTIITLNDPRNIAYTGKLFYENEKGIQKTASFLVNGPNLTVRVETKNHRKFDPITLVFNEQVDSRSFAENLKIIPKTNFTISYDLNRITLTPTAEWLLTSQYRIDISADYESKNGKQFVNNQVLSFSILKDPTPNQEVFYPEITFQNKDNFIVTQALDMALNFNAQHLDKNVPVLVEVYRLGGTEKFKNQAAIFRDYDLDLSVLEKVDTNAFIIANGANRMAFSNPGPGSYVVSATYENPTVKGNIVEVRTGYLVTPYTIYMQSSKNETLAWLHDSTTNSPAVGHTIMFNNDPKRTAKTDEEGVAILPHNPLTAELKEAHGYDDDYYREVVTTGVSVLNEVGELVYYDDANLRTEDQSRDTYYSYLFTDRTIYKPEDTISFWGYVKPFWTNEKDMPKSVFIIFDKEGLNIRIEAPISENGTFIGELPLEQVKSSEYQMESVLIFPADKEKGEEKATEVQLNTRYFSVKEFEKPAYTLDTRVVESFHGPYDRVTVTATPAFYDGTPLPNFPLEGFYYNPKTETWKSVGKIMTDQSGLATFSFPAQEKTNKSDYSTQIGLRSNNYRVQIATDGETVTKVGSYNYLNSDVLMESSIEKQEDGKNLSLTLKTYLVDTDAPAFRKELNRRIAAKEASDATSNAEDNYYYEYEYYYGYGADSISGLCSNENLLKYAKGEPVTVNTHISLRWQYMDPSKIEHENRRRSLSESFIKFNNNYSFDYTVIPAEQMKIIDDWETQEKRVSVTLSDGVAVLDDLIFLPEGTEIDFTQDSYCRAYIDYTDTLGGSYSSYAYYPTSSKDYDWNPQRATEKPKPVGLTFEVTDVTSGDNLTPPEHYYRQIKVNAGTETRFKVLKDGDPVEENGKIFYSIIQGGLYEYHVINANEFTLDYRMDFGPSVQLVAAYFDGYRVHYIKNLELAASNESLGITIDVTPDKASYRPGDTVQLDVKSTNYLGEGTAGNLCISVVDESVFALSEQRLDILGGLYENFRYMDNYVTKYCTTYRSGDDTTGLWSGGKGDSDGMSFYDSYRENFKDTAFFLGARTNSDGTAVVEFQLPDNTTSWRITALEIGDDMRVGQAKSNIISTLPFFVQPVITSKYIEGDEISMLVQGHGILLDSKSEIDYTVTLVGDKTRTVLTAKGLAYEPWEFNFGALPIGSYTVEAKAQYSGYSDTVSMPVNVIKSNLELVVNKPIPLTLEQPLQIAALRYPVSLSIYDGNNDGFIASLSSLFGHYCSMPSQRLSRFTAKRVLSQSVENADIPYYIATGNDSIADYQKGDGGLSGDKKSELAFTTYLTLVAPDQFNQNSLKAYLEKQIARPSLSAKDQASAYLALSNLGGTNKEAIFEKLYTKDSTQVNDKLPLDVQAYYIAALAYLGEKEVATTLYQEQLAQHVKTLNLTESSNYSYDEADIARERDAAAIWIAASLLNEEDADKLSLHFGNYRWRYRTLFEAMIYMTNYERLIRPLSYSYTLNGQSYTKKLALGSLNTMVLNRSELESLIFTQLDDDLKATAYYIGEPSELGIQPSSLVSIEKSVKALDKNTYRVTLHLKLSKEAPNGEYNISDWIPSNSRLYPSGKLSYRHTETEGQKIYFNYYKNSPKDLGEEISYEIRQTYRAQSMLDSTYVIHGESGINTSSQRVVFAPDNTNYALPMVHADSSKNVIPDRPAVPEPTKEEAEDLASSELAETQEESSEVSESSASSESKTD